MGTPMTSEAEKAAGRQNNVIHIKGMQLVRRKSTMKTDPVSKNRQDSGHMSSTITSRSVSCCIKILLNSG